MFEIEASSDLILPGGRPMSLANMTSVATGDIARDPEVRKLVTQLGGWIEQSRQRIGDAPGMFNRALYQVSENPYHQMRVARTAVREDDVIGGLADSTEALAFDGGLKWESSNADEADVFNQLSADLNLDGKIREMWREDFTVNQFICAKLWDTIEYTVRGTTENGNKKKKKYKIYAPTRLVMLRPENVVPTGWGPLREDTLAWQATINEIGQMDRITNGGAIDPLMSVFFTDKYEPGLDEARELTEWGVNIDQLLSMNPDWVFRHTSTRPDWSKHPDIRMRAVFTQLDLKRQLVASDRAMLIGSANYILLIRKGSKEKPATQDEIANLHQNYNFFAKIPVIISDNRLEIDVIAPKLDFVLKKEAYEVLDERILNRVLDTFTPPGRALSNGSSGTFTDVLASALQNRRHMIKRTLEKEIAKAIIEHPRNEGIFEEKPSLVFTPRTVSIGSNADVLAAMLALRTQREISRDTILEYLGLDEATEAQRLDVEAQLYDHIFKTQIPFAAPGAGGAPAAGDTQQPQPTPNGTPEAPANSGKRGGGRPRGGGTSPQSPQAQSKPRTRSGNPSTKAADDDDE